ncbi:MAG: hypothetical protein FJX72_08350 [Armatimonadetes bacterium]|nr:hypothetical protein [Armatimonadota bacterium]
MLTDDVEGWLQVTDYAGDAPKKARELRSTAFDTLLASGRTESAEEMLAAIRPLDQLRKARLREQQGQHELAAKLFEREGRVQDALRNWRQAGEWDEALRLADNPVMQADLRWLHDVNQTMQRRPQGIRGRLTPAEEARLAAVVRPCLRSSGDEREHADDKPGKSPHRTPR